MESTTVDQWLDVVNNEVDVPLGVLYGALMGWYPVDEVNAARARQDLDKVLKVIDAQLKDKTYLVGSQLTLADVVLASSLVQLFRYLLTEKVRSTLPNLSRWF
jgi:elongation factor 1-gamma